MRLPCDFEYDDESNPYRQYSEIQLIRSIRDEVIHSIPECEIAPHPTNTIEYSNWGSALLGNAISARSKLNYAEMLREWITVPLGMKDTDVKLSVEQKHRLAQGYNEKLKPTGLWERLGMMGNGEIMSTTSDLIIYAQAMLNPESTSLSNAIKRVQKRQYLNIAYNWFVTPTGSIWHDGMTGGYSSLFKAYLSRDFAIFSLSNTVIYIKCMIETVEEIPCSL